jgi:subtilisin family serine protease
VTEDRQFTSRHGRPVLRRAIVSDALLDDESAQGVDLRPGESGGYPVVIELNLQHARGLQGAEARLRAHWSGLEAPPPEVISDTYARAELTTAQIRTLVAADLAVEDAGQRAIYRIWPDYPVKPLVDASVSTVKADAARRSYDATGRGIVWAVIDSGIDRSHPHFKAMSTLGGDVARLHRDFTQPGRARSSPALTDPYGHGTHVAGIISGGLSTEQVPGLRVVERVQDPDDPRESLLRDRKVADARLLRGMAPHTKLVSLRVLDAEGRGSSMNVVRALEYVRKQLNGQSKMMRVHGVNLSVGYEFDPEWFACGQSPLCVEVDRLVRSGVVVVVAAGNTGYGTLSSIQRTTNAAFGMTINDPGNADLAVTVGSTHRDMPHTYGVSYFSSKGPTGDGRVKPDLVAPGERITSAAAGRALVDIDGKPGQPLYVEDSGTSMAAPHVSGVIAAFLSVRREFVGRPEEVKRIFVGSATSLGRESYFQGAGLVDLMRSIQSV